MWPDLSHSLAADSLWFSTVLHILHLSTVDTVSVQYSRCRSNGKLLLTLLLIHCSTTPPPLPQKSQQLFLIIDTLSKIYFIFPPNLRGLQNSLEELGIYHQRKNIACVLHIYPIKMEIYIRTFALYIDTVHLILGLNCRNILPFMCPHDPPQIITWKYYTL